MEDGDAAASHRKRREVCDNCRIRHVRCRWDAGGTCRPCRSIGLDCTRQPKFRIRYDQRQRDLSSNPQPRWLRVKGPLTFCDETAAVQESYTGETATYAAPFQAPESPNISSGPNQAQGYAAILSMESPASGPVPALSQPRSGYLSSPSDWTSPRTLGVSPSDSRSVATPFSEAEAILIRNYVSRMALWTDAHDPMRTFELELPRRALTEPILRHAICAFSARHMYRDLDIGETEALAHQDQCLELLIPAMSDSHGINESTLMAVAILRQNEEMDEQDNRFHLEGVSRILNTVPHFAAAGGLGEAAAWLCLREEIYVSLTTQSPITLSLERFRESASIQRGDDVSWSSLMVLELAILLKRAFCDSANQEDLAASEVSIAEWSASKPASYTPIHFRPRNPKEQRCFPEYWMLATHHAVGLQYFHIAKVVLQIMRQKVDTAPYDLLRENRSREKLIRHHLLIVVGIAISNERAENTWFTARHCLSVWGGCLRKPSDQQAALQFLSAMSERTGWKMSSLIESLRAQWEEDTSEGG